MWKRAVTTGNPPTARDSHSCSSWKNKIVVIGGEDEHDYYLSDVHILDTGKKAFLNTCSSNLTSVSFIRKDFFSSLFLF